MSEVLNKIRRELDAFAETKKALVAELRNEFPNMFKDIISKAETFETLSWTQYTPYFNDGEACEFSTNIDYLDIDDDDIYSREDLKYFLYGKILTEEDKVFNDEIAVKEGNPHMIGRNIGQDGYVKNQKYNEHDGEIYNSIKTVLSEIPDEFYLELFGDHSKVILNKDGTIVVEEYEHD
jgi:hypothetical protein